MHRFKAVIDIIGINPYVFVPDKILQSLFEKSGKEKGTIPVFGTINGKDFKQTLVKFSGHWRLYINTTMLKDSPKRIGEKIDITVGFDPEERTITPHSKLIEALRAEPKAKQIFDGLPASRQKEIVRYISSLKTESSVDKNVSRAIDFLLGKARFIGREKP
ncbi:MAG: DUF1905 domain-containing protein [Chitinophagaceae bacterium]|nr:MAG: DUF1905 domain-containing protein [Chitinophagaceae bacterium]